MAVCSRPAGGLAFQGPRGNFRMYRNITSGSAQMPVLRWMPPVANRHPLAHQASLHLPQLQWKGRGDKELASCLEHPANKQGGESPYEKMITQIRE